MREIRSTLRFFRDDTPVAERRRRWLFLALWVAVASMLVWPIYPLFAGIEPRLFALPLGLAWVVIAMLVMFGALLWLFWHDEMSDR